MCPDFVKEIIAYIGFPANMHSGDRGGLKWKAKEHFLMMLRTQQSKDRMTTSLFP